MNFKRVFLVLQGLFVVDAHIVLVLCRGCRGVEVRVDGRTVKYKGEICHGLFVVSKNTVDRYCRPGEPCRYYLWLGTRRVGGVGPCSFTS